MTKDEQAKQLERILNALKISLLSRVEHFPEHWDRHEIWQYVSDKVRADVPPMHAKKLRRYRNDLLTRSL